jgi:predicted transcriptional regulator
MSTITVRIPDELDPIIDEFCKEEDRSKSWLVKKALKEKLQEWRDVRIALEARGEYEKNPNILLSHDEVWGELGLKKKHTK